MNYKDIRPRNGMGDSVECEQSLNRFGLEKWLTPMVLEIWCFMSPAVSLPNAERIVPLK
jgi:hypothetical protein